MTCSRQNASRSRHRLCHHRRSYQLLPAHDASAYLAMTRSAVALTPRTNSPALAYSCRYLACYLSLLFTFSVDFDSLLVLLGGEAGRASSEEGGWWWEGRRRREG